MESVERERVFSELEIQVIQEALDYRLTTYRTNAISPYQQKADGDIRKLLKCEETATDRKLIRYQKFLYTSIGLYLKHMFFKLCETDDEDIHDCIRSILYCCEYLLDVFSVSNAVRLMYGDKNIYSGYYYD